MLYDDFRHRYAVLAAEKAKDPDMKKAGMAITDQLVNDGNLTDEEFKIGNTKIFFKVSLRCSRTICFLFCVKSFFMR